MVESPMEELGEACFEFLYDGGKRTRANCLTVSSARELLAKRVNFIIDRQQMTRRDDPRYGAYLVYDNETDELFLNDRPTVSPADRDEGGERLGMGGTQKYLDEASRQLPQLEAFASFQPDYHMNEIAIRHWDGYWFGKREMWGDVYPHYWSTLTAAAYHYYSQCTGDASYQCRAENIVRNNLCLFFEDGKASCAYVYPYRVNGVRAGFYDPFANDQDWALVYYLLVNDDL